MADVYCDQSLGSGSDNGTNWTNAYKLLATALNGSNTVAGDTLWVKNNNTTSNAVTFTGPSDFSDNPLRVIGCRGDTSRTPPIAADIIPGLRNGSSTRAYAQTGGDLPPTFTTTVSSNSITFSGYLGFLYGIIFKSFREIQIMQASEGTATFEECHIRCGNGEGGEFRLGRNGQNPAKATFKNSKLSGPQTNSRINTWGNGLFNFINCEMDLADTGGIVRQGAAVMNFEDCDFSAQSGPMILIESSGVPQGLDHFKKCKIHASSALISVTASEEFRIEFIQTSSVIAKGTGESYLEFDILTSEGDIVLEATAVRTGGADDGGDGAWSMAFTPNVNDTRDNLVGLVGPWISKFVAGDGTSQTLTVHISNDLAEDAGNKYNDDDVWLEVRAPSEAGTAQYDYYTTQMDLEATPAEIQTETVAWGTGAANDQRLSVTLAPDYNGLLQWRVIFAKNFGATPDTLYVDGRSTLS